MGDVVWFCAHPSPGLPMVNPPPPPAGEGASKEGEGGQENSLRARLGPHGGRRGAIERWGRNIKTDRLLVKYIDIYIDRYIDR